MIGNKSTTKKVIVNNPPLTSSSERSSLSILMRRYKSQNVYVSSPLKFGQVKKSNKNPHTNSPNTASANLNNIKSDPKEFSIKLEAISTPKIDRDLLLKKIPTSPSNFLMKEEPMESPLLAKRKKEIPDRKKKKVSKINSYLASKPRQIAKVVGEKIINDESIQELDSEENIVSMEENKEKDKGADEDADLDEMKSSQLNMNFYTNSINEDACEEQIHLINRFPKPVVNIVNNKFSEKTDQNEERDTIPFVKANTMKELSTVDASQHPPSRKNKKKKNLKDPPPSDKKEFSNSTEKVESFHRKLLLSAKKGDREAFLECLELVLNHCKGNIQFKDESGWTALHFACDEGNLKIVEMLIKANIDVNAKTNDKKSPLHLATSHGYFDISKLLVENGAMINSYDDEKNNPVHLCASSDHIELLKYLLDRFPQADLKNIYGKTPYDLAVKSEVKELIKEYLKKNESQYHKVKIYTTNTKQTESMFKNISRLQKGVNINNNVILKTPVKYTDHPNMTIDDYSIPTTKHLPHSTQHNKQPLNKCNTSATTGGCASKFMLSSVRSGNFWNNNCQNNNININISTNFNNTGSNLSSNSKQFKFNDKVKVTVEAKLGGVGELAKNTDKMKITNTSKNFQPGISHTIQDTRQYSTLNSYNYYSANQKLPREMKITQSSYPQPSCNPESEGIKEDPDIETLSPHPQTGKTDNVTSLEIHLNSEAIDQPGLSNDTGEQPSSIEEDIEKCECEGNIDKCMANGSNASNNIHNQSKNDDNNSNSQSVMPSLCTDEEKITPGAFVCHALIGKGSFGEVYLVEKKNTKTFYAMKVLSKDKIMGQNLVKYAMTERNVLSITNHPFIVKLSYAFQTMDRLFLILDYCPGGDLAKHLADEKRFTEERSKIYICEIISALEDLHKRDIIFRDLKPDNVVLDVQGHAMLTDFGLSKEGVMDAESAKSFCGSIAYLAPEMLKKKGHGKSVDWYLLGVLFYEMLVGIPPYFTDNKDQIFRNIEHAELQIPKFVSENACTILRALLQRDPQLRLGGSQYDAEEVKSHEYFKDINWIDVYNRQLHPPLPKFRNKALHHFSRPRMFAIDDAVMQYSNSDNFFDGWSFINQEKK